MDSDMDTVIKFLLSFKKETTVGEIISLITNDDIDLKQFIDGSK
jgi:hypothetical protein